MTHLLKKFVLMHRATKNHIFVDSIVEAGHYIRIQEIGFGPKEDYDLFEKEITLEDSDRVPNNHPDFEL